MTVSTTDFDTDLNEIATKFKRHVKVSDRTYRLKSYKQCFIGSEAVDYLVESGATLTREDAVEIGKAFMEMRLFEHVCRDHEFKDEYLFYRFLEGNERGSYKIDEQTGESIKWSNFLGVDKVDPSADHESWQPKLPQPDLEKINPKDRHVAKHVWPMDDYNTNLLNNVHPPEWQDPASTNKDGSSSYDLVVIGAGAGGLVTAAGAAGVGAKVAIIEENLLGGDCLNVGCVVCITTWNLVALFSSALPFPNPCVPVSFLLIQIRCYRHPPLFLYERDSLQKLLSILQTWPTQ
mmetsp:Transcript_30418/g.50532  ORF Transcript_30418/g.50532 Transcript_30418/m.50532 type:complete len:291 (+) Transcript_30418:161-1033(+)